MTYEGLFLICAFCSLPVIAFVLDAAEGIKRAAKKRRIAKCRRAESMRFRKTATENT